MTTTIITKEEKHCLCFNIRGYLSEGAILKSEAVKLVTMKATPLKTTQSQ